LVGTKHTIASSNWSGIQVWDVDRESKTSFIRYVWAGKVNWPELRDKIQEIADGVAVNQWCVIYNPSSEQLYAEMRAGQCRGITGVSFIHEKNVLENHTGFVNALIERRLFLNSNRQVDCEQIERDWCVANRTESAAPIHLKLSVHGEEHARHFGESWGGLASQSGGVFSRWSSSSIVK
jgi:hypothetical protein